VDAKVGSLREVVAQLSVHVLVAAALPGEWEAQKYTGVPSLRVILR
jgi:hypothetical protein